MHKSLERMTVSRQKPSFSVSSARAAGRCHPAGRRKTPCLYPAFLCSVLRGGSVYCLCTHCGLPTTPIKILTRCFFAGQGTQFQRPAKLHAAAYTPKHGPVCRIAPSRSGHRCPLPQNSPIFSVPCSGMETICVSSAIIVPTVDICCTFVL